MARRTAVLVLLSCSLLSSCSSWHYFQYGMGAWMRGAPDYDALEAERGAPARPGHAAATTDPPPYWTQYRGPRGDGTYDERPLRRTWPEDGPPRLWRVPVGPAYSSVVVAGGVAITMEQRREDEVVLAFGRETGELWWEHAWPARFYETASKAGPRATPAVQGDAVVAFGATGELRCLDLATGALRWRHHLPAPGVENLDYGLSASPRLQGDLVIAQGVERVYAFDLATGALRWATLPEPMAYATPQLGEVLGRTTVIACTATRVVGLDVESGTELWSFRWRVSGRHSCTQPVVVAPDRILVSAGYGKGSRLIALAEGPDGVESSVVWRSGRFKTRFNEPVLIDGFAYGLDEGTLACLDPSTGRLAWKDGRYGYGQLLATGDGLLVVGEDGVVHLLDADPTQATLVGSFSGVEEGLALNVPALAHGLLYLRTDRELVCYDLRRP